MRPARSRDPSWGTAFGRRFGTSIGFRLLPRFSQLLIGRLSLSFNPKGDGSASAVDIGERGGHEAQVDRRRNRAGGAEQGVGQLEERVGSALEAPVE
jgi:hypothetical protein